MIIEIECLPSPLGTPDDPYRHVEAAIAQIQQSGLTYEVNALGTTFQGEPDECWALARRVHEACLAAGARSLVTVAKFEQHADPATQPTIASLTGKFRA